MKFLTSSFDTSHYKRVLKINDNSSGQRSVINWVINGKSGLENQIFQTLVIMSAGHEDLKLHGSKDFLELI